MTFRAKDRDAATTWQQDLNRFYRFLQRLEHGLGGARKLSTCTGRDPWPARGLYFFFEPGETRCSASDVSRIVRVGTHAVSAGSQSNLWTRLRTHRGHDDGTGNHRGSIFRLHIGAALLAASRCAKSPISWGKRQSASKEIREAEVDVERAVSQYLGNMSVLWLSIEDASSPSSDRAYLERQSIGLLAHFLSPFDQPSGHWLGRFSPKAAIRDSGLWNLNYVSSGYDPEFLDVLADYIEITLGKLPPPKRSIAPKEWHTRSSRVSGNQRQMQFVEGDAKWPR